MPFTSNQHKLVDAYLNWSIRLSKAGDKKEALGEDPIRLRKLSAKALAKAKLLAS